MDFNGMNLIEKQKRESFHFRCKRKYIFISLSCVSIDFNDLTPTPVLKLKSSFKKMYQKSIQICTYIYQSKLLFVFSSTMSYYFRDVRSSYLMSSIYLYAFYLHYIIFSSEFKFQIIPKNYKIKSFWVFFLITK